MVADDYTVPANGELTTISWNGTYITDTEFLTAVSRPCLKNKSCTNGYDLVNY